MVTIVSTPPHLPTYGVRLSDSRIRTIINTIFPNLETIHIEQLESGKSYNNRIYFIDAGHNENPEAAGGGLKRLVLKLAGHFFDHRKIENELGCLLLLKEYCPEIPVPDVFAWSTKGRAIETVDGRVVKAPDDFPFSDHPWILTSRLPGRSLTVADLDSEQGPGILKQLAGYMAGWRTQLPEVSGWGNLHICATEEVEDRNKSFKHLLTDKEFVVNASLFHTFAWPTTGQYYPTSAADQLVRLEKEPQFQWTWKTHGESLKRWASESLSQETLCQQKEYKFTHFDFSPRNVLISDDAGPPKVSGVLDFEFAGFFPPQEEFLNAMIRQSEDWEESHWKIIMTELAQRGQKVPLLPGISKELCFDDTEWNKACLIVKIIDRIAPWEIMADKFEKEELQEELEKAAGMVNDSLRELRLLETVLRES